MRLRARLAVPALVALAAGCPSPHHGDSAGPRVVSVRTRFGAPASGAIVVSDSGCTTTDSAGVAVVEAKAGGDLTAHAFDAFGVQESVTLHSVGDASAIVITLFEDNGEPPPVSTLTVHATGALDGRDVVLGAGRCVAIVGVVSGTSATASIPVRPRCLARDGSITAWAVARSVIDPSADLYGAATDVLATGTAQVPVGSPPEDPFAIQFTNVPSSLADPGYASAAWRRNGGAVSQVAADLMTSSAGSLTTLLTLAGKSAADSVLVRSQLNDGATRILAIGASTLDGATFDLASLPPIPTSLSLDTTGGVTLRAQLPVATDLALARISWPGHRWIVATRADAGALEVHFPAVGTCDAAFAPGAGLLPGLTVMQESLGSSVDQALAAAANPNPPPVFQSVWSALGSYAE